MRVEVLEVLVARQRQINAELEAIRKDIEGHEAAIQRAYEDGAPLADESKSISRELKIELGLIDQPATQAGPEAID